MLEVIASSSKGNGFILGGEILIDAGLPYSKLQPHLNNIKVVLLTHEHKDHINPATMRKLIANHNPLFLCGEWLSDQVLSKKKHIVSIGQVYNIGLTKYKVSPIQLYHDVPNCGWRIAYGEYRHIHATDTCHLDGIDASGYDSASLECNHCEIKATELIDNAKVEGKWTHLIGAMNSHLSVQQAVDFCKTNGIKRLYPCHIGESTKPEVLKYIENTGLATINS